jgi:hypothetical protein
MRDLSALAADSMWITSQEGGNMIHDNTGAWSAPGTEPVTPMPDADHQPDPHVAMIPKPLSVGTTGQGYAPAPVAWKGTPDA